MATELGVITGVHGDLAVTRFWGGNESRVMFQITQVLPLDQGGRRHIIQVTTRELAALLRLASENDLRGGK